LNANTSFEEPEDVEETKSKERLSKAIIAINHGKSDEKDDVQATLS
jgi:hypothetical protein